MVKKELMENWQQRTKLLLEEEKTEHLGKSHMLVVGLGGVGAYAAEMICRAGVNRMTIVGADIVQPTNINRRLPAMYATLGMEKTEVLEVGFRNTNPEIELNVLPVYLKDENTPELPDASKYDFMVDVIDTIGPKCYLVYHALQCHIKIVSNMGTETKGGITQIHSADLWDTCHYGFSKAVRKRLQKMRVKCELPVVLSTE